MMHTRFVFKDHIKCNVTFSLEEFGDLVPEWVILIIVALPVDPCLNSLKIIVCHYAWKLVEPCVYHLFTVLLKTVSKNLKPGLTHWVCLKIIEVVVALQPESGHGTNDCQFEGVHNIILAYGSS